MKAEKIHLIEYQCPSCGADLHYREDQFMITCKYCGARVERELDRSAQDKVYAKQCLAAVTKYRKNMKELKRLEKNRESAKQRVKLCSQNVLAEPTLLESVPYLPFIIALPISFFLILASQGEASSMVLLGLILVVSGIVAGVSVVRGTKKKHLAAQAKGRIDDAQKEFVKAGKELEAFEKSFDKKEIPVQYRSEELLEYLQHVFETQQACTMGDGFKLCDDHIAQKQLEDIKNEELAMVRLTLAQRPIQELSYKQPDEFRELSLFGGASQKTTARLFESVARAKQKINDKKD